jgi:serine protease Do
MPKRALTKLVVFPLLALTQPSARSQRDLSALVNQLKSSVVTVIGFNGDGKPVAQGTGFFVGTDGTLITNHHVLAEAQKASIKTRSGRVYDIVETLAEDADGDLIAVRANIKGLVVQPLRISTAPVLPGQRIVVIGSPFGLDQTVSEGIVSAVRSRLT